MTFVRHLILTAILSASFTVVGCSESDNDDVTDDVLAETSDAADSMEDAEGDTASDTEDTAEDSTEDALPDDARTKGQFEECEEHIECFRGLFCDELVNPPECTLANGCFVFGSPDPDGDTACLISENGSGTPSAIECETDADCADSEYGSNCIERGCTDAEPCETDDDCPGAQVCNMGIHCWDG